MTHPYLGHPSISKKKYTIKSMLFSISIKKTESPHEKKIFVTFGTCEKIEVKRGQLVKEWEFDQKKNILMYQLFKTRIYAFMTNGQFPPKSSSNLRSVIQDSRVRDLWPHFLTKLPLLTSIFSQVLEDAKNYFHGVILFFS